MVLNELLHQICKLAELRVICNQYILPKTSSGEIWSQLLEAWDIRECQDCCSSVSCRGLCHIQHACRIHNFSYVKLGLYKNGKSKDISITCKNSWTVLEIQCQPTSMYGSRRRRLSAKYG